MKFLSLFSFATLGACLALSSSLLAQNPPVTSDVEEVRFPEIEGGASADWREFLVDVETNPPGDWSSFTWEATLDGTSGARLESTTGDAGDSIKVLEGNSSLPDSVKIEIKDTSNAVVATKLIEIGTDSRGDTREKMTKSGCKECDESCESAGTSSAGLDSLYYRLNIGSGNYGSAAYVIIRAESYQTSLYDPVGLVYVGSRASAEGFEVNETGGKAGGGGELNWVRTPTTFMKVESITSTGYYISIYKHSDVNQSTNTPTGSPIRKVRVYKPTTDELRIDEITGGKGLCRRYKYTASPKKWELWEGSSSELTDSGAPKKTVLTTAISGSTKTVNKKVYGYDYSLGTGNHLVYEEQRVYEIYTWGEVETSLRVDPSGKNYTTTKTYYLGGSALTGRLKSVIYPNGYWNYYVYYGSGLIDSVYAPFGDTSTPTTSSSGTEKIKYSYASSPTRVTRDVFVNGTQISREWTETVVGSTTVAVETQRAQSSAAGWDNSANLKTIITRDKSTNRIASIAHPDGQTTTYSYLAGSYSGWSYSGETYSYGYISTEPSIRITKKTGIFSGSTLIDGTQSEMERNQLGEVLEDKQTGVDPTGGSRVFHEAKAYKSDDFKRVTDTLLVHINNKHTYKVYDCCTVQYEVDELGMATETLTDVLSRVRTRNHGVWGGSSISSYVQKLEYQRDGMGRVRKVIRKRIVADSTPSEIRLENNTYNVAGELESTKKENALGVADVNEADDYETKYSTYVSGGRLYELVSRPSMGTSPSGHPTEYRVYYRDGTLKEKKSYAASASLNTTAQTGSIIEWLKYSRTISGGSLASTVISAGSAGTGTARWETTKYNYLGQAFQVLRPRGNGSGTTVTESLYYGSSGSEKGQLIRRVDPDGVTTRYAYNNLGERYRTAVDRDTGSTASINLADDQLTETENYWTLRGSDIVHRTITYLYSVNGNSSTKKIIQQSDRHRNGWESWELQNGQETFTELTSTANGDWKVTATRPDGSKSIESINDGLPDYNSLETGTGGIISKVTASSFDGHRRVTQVTDYRFGYTTKVYGNQDQVTSETRPSPTGSGTVAYSLSYDSNRNLTGVTYPSSAGTQTKEYHANGLLKKEYGTEAYTTEYVYDSYGGQVTTMTTLYGSSSATANTTWNYDSYRGWLLSKRDHSNNGTAYEYTAGGRLSKRTWARGDYAIYSYTDAGELRLVDYTDTTLAAGTTPDIEYSYNRTGTMAWAKDGASDGTAITTQRYIYSDYYLSDYPFVGGSTIISGVHTESKYLLRQYSSGVTNRPSGFQLGTLFDPDNDMEVVYSYVANDGRLYQVTSESYETNTDTFTYSYGSAGQVSPTLVSGPMMYSTRAFLSNAPYFDTMENRTVSGGSIVGKADYRYNELGQRDRKDFSGTAYGSATYDSYAYNSNFEVTQGKRYTSGGSAISGKEFNYTYDAIGNRLTSQDKYNTSGYQTTYTPTATNQYSAITGYQSQSPISYDTDGNLTSMGSKNFIYNAENQLIEVKNGSTSLASFEYDYMGRRIKKVTPSKTETYLYDGWNLIAVYDTGTADKRPLITYSWGLDLSDSLKGAGGVGGLLMSCERSGSAWTYFHDGHGNITQVISQSSGSLAHHLEYDPFGKLVTTAPSWTRVNAFRFSSKFYDEETDLYYYGYRYYDAVRGRWINRDPIGERGGVNLFGFVGNDGVNYWDYLGLEDDSICCVDGRYKVPYDSEKQCCNGEGILDKYEICITSEVPTLISGHAWITVTNKNTNVKNTYGFWGLAARSVRIDSPGVKMDIDLEKYEPRALDPTSQYISRRCKTICGFEVISFPGNFEDFTRNCSSFARAQWKSSTGEDLSTSLNLVLDIFDLFLDSPSILAASIDFENNGGVRWIPLR